MSWGHVGLGLLGLLGLKALSSSEAEHHDVVEEAYDALAGAIPENASIYADHLPDRDVPHPRNAVDGLTKVPDVVVKSGEAQSLLVEVETAASLTDQPTAAKAQLQDFSKQGYRRLLVVPDGQRDNDVVTSFVAEVEESFDGEIHLATPGDVASYL